MAYRSRTAMHTLPTSFFLFQPRNSSRIFSLSYRNPSPFNIPYVFSLTFLRIGIFCCVWCHCDICTTSGEFHLRDQMNLLLVERATKASQQFCLPVLLKFRLTLDWSVILPSAYTTSNCIVTTLSPVAMCIRSHNGLTHSRILKCTSSTTDFRLNFCTAALDVKFGLVDISLYTLSSL